MTAFAARAGVTLARRPILMRSSFHESGHAVLAVDRRLGLDFAEVAVDLAANRLGRVRFGDANSAFSTFDYCVMLLAGREAEQCACGHVALGSDAGDWQQAREAARQAGVPAALVDEILAEARAEAEREVSRLWGWITAVAAALRRDRVLSAEQIQQLRCG